MNRPSRIVFALILCSLVALGGCKDEDSGNNGGEDAASDVVEADAAEDAAEDTAEDSAQDASDDTTDDVAEDTAEDTVQDTEDGGDTADTADSQDTSEDTTDTSSANDGDTCEVAIDVTAGGTFADQTTVGFSNDYDASATADNCPAGSASGADIVYVVSPSAETTYTFTVEPQGSTYDPFIYLKSDCSADACLDGTVLNGPGVQESLEYTVAGGETVYVIVDGELVTEGAFDLTVSTP
jgi:hypothetical protein